MNADDLRPEARGQAGISPRLSPSALSASSADKSVRDCVAAMVEAAADNACRGQNTVFTERASPVLASEQQAVVAELRRLRIGFLLLLSDMSRMQTITIMGDARATAAWAEITKARNDENAKGTTGHEL